MRPEPGKRVAPIRTQARSATILPNFVGLKFQVHNGKVYHDVTITEEMVGHKLGEFSPYATSCPPSGIFQGTRPLTNRLLQDTEDLYLEQEIRKTLGEARLKIPGPQEGDPGKEGLCAAVMYIICNNTRPRSEHMCSSPRISAHGAVTS